MKKIKITRKRLIEALAIADLAADFDFDGSEPGSLEYDAALLGASLIKLVKDNDMSLWREFVRKR